MSFRYWGAQNWTRVSTYSVIFAEWEIITSLHLLTMLLLMQPGMLLAHAQLALCQDIKVLLSRAAPWTVSLHGAIPCYVPYFTLVLVNR